jgi:hypothetical protein
MILEANERIFGQSVFRGVTRLEKLIFLLEEETSFEGVGEFFPFEAHNFGPFSKEVYAAVEFLEGIDLIEVSERTYASPKAVSEEEKLAFEISDDEQGSLATEKLFALTENGRKVAKIMRESVARKKKSDVEELEGIVRKYGSRPLNHLIRYVYRQYPALTTNSIHPEAARLQDTSAQ